MAHMKGAASKSVRELQQSGDVSEPQLPTSLLIIYKKKKEKSIGPTTRLRGEFVLWLNI